MWTSKMWVGAVQRTDSLAQLACKFLTLKKLRRSLQPSTSTGSNSIVESSILTFILSLLWDENMTTLRDNETIKFSTQLFIKTNEWNWSNKNMSSLSSLFGWDISNFLRIAKTLSFCHCVKNNNKFYDRDFSGAHLLPCRVPINQHQRYANETSV